MNDFRVKVVEDSGDISIYTNATSIDVDNDKIVVTYKGTIVTHSFDATEEVTIKKNT